MEIRACKQLTSKPFGVNVTKLPMIAAGDMFSDMVKVLIDEKVPVIETAGSPMPEEWAAFKKAGMVVVHKCTSIRHALRAQKVRAHPLHSLGKRSGHRRPVPPPSSPPGPPGMAWHGFPLDL